ncbi:MAG: hypothetical protein ACM3P0_02085 [Acidobacteriota bacterium]
MKALFLFLLIFSVSLYSQIPKDSSTTYKLANIRAVTPAGNYDAPRWSPDGNKILFTSQSSAGLYVVDLSSKQITELLDLSGSGYNATWSDDSKSIFYRNATRFGKETKSINITTHEITPHPEIDFSSVPSRAGIKAEDDIFLYLGPEAFEIKASKVDRSKEWDIVKRKREGERFYSFELSPDRKKVLVHHYDNMLIYASDGSGLVDSLDQGSGGRWSADGKTILYFITKDDGHVVLGSDIYLISSDGTQKWQLTNTPDVFEWEPDWSPDNKQIVFSDLKTGIIYIADIIKN